MRKSVWVPSLFLILIVVFYLPILFPLGFLSNYYDFIYKVVNPFLTMPLIVGILSLYVFRRDFHKKFKFTFVALYGLITLLTIIGIFVFILPINKLVLIILLPHLIIIYLLSKEAKALRDQALDHTFKDEEWFLYKK